MSRYGARCVWLTGLSGAGKTTIAMALISLLEQKNMRAYLLDGDVIRQGLNADLGFTTTDRNENVRRVSYLATALVDAGVYAIVSSISPYAEARDRARSMFEPDDFIEVYVATPLDVCVERDTKGLYRKALRGELKNLTGWDDPYEAPVNPEVVIDTGEVSASYAAAKIFESLVPNTVSASCRCA